MIEILLGLLAWTVFAVLFLPWWFFALTRLRNLGFHVNSWSEFVDSIRDLWTQTHPLLVIPLAIGAPIGALCDIWWNVTIGTVLFRELPREFFFTSRVKRHSREGDDTGMQWRGIINWIQPGHI